MAGDFAIISAGDDEMTPIKEPPLKETDASGYEEAVKFLEQRDREAQELAEKQKNIKLRDYDAEPMLMREILYELIGELGFRIKCYFRRIFGIDERELLYVNEEHKKYMSAVKNVEAQVDRIFEEHSKAGTLITYPAGQKETAIRAIKDIYLVPGLIGIDVLDVFTCIRDVKKIYVAVSDVFKGEGKAVKAAKNALSILEGKFKRAALNSGLFNVQGDKDFTLYEVNDIAEEIYGYCDNDTNIVFGANVDVVENGVRIVLLMTEKG